MNTYFFLFAKCYSVVTGVVFNHYYCINAKQLNTTHATYQNVLTFPDVLIRKAPLLNPDQRTLFVGKFSARPLAPGHLNSNQLLCLICPSPILQRTLCSVGVNLAKKLIIVTKLVQTCVKILSKYSSNN